MADRAFTMSCLSYTPLDEVAGESLTDGLSTYVVTVYGYIRFASDYYDPETGVAYYGPQGAETSMRMDMHIETVSPEGTFSDCTSSLWCRWHATNLDTRLDMGI